MSPITFTSTNDNSVGGTTGSGSPAAGDWAGIYSDGGSIDLQYARVSYEGSVSGTQMVSLTAINDVFSTPGTRYASLIAEASTAVVSNDSFLEEDANDGGPALVVEASSLEVMDNAVTGFAGNPSGASAYIVDSGALDFGQLSTNTADSGMMEVAGSAATSTWSGSMPLTLGTGTEYVGLVYEDYNLDVPSGVTLTLDPGTVVKAFGETNGLNNNLSVEGTLDAVGSSMSPITFTSTNDNSVGGTTGSGSPAAGDWAGITVSGTGSIDMEHDRMDYAGSAISTVSDSEVVVENGRFDHNNYALRIDATVGTNAAIHGNWFDGNDVSIDASSDWSPVNPVCEFVPTISADGNVYGTSESTSAPVSQSDYDEIQAEMLQPDTETYPDGWTDDIVAGTSDIVQGWLGSLPCATPPDGAPVCDVLGIPLNFEPGLPEPAACAADDNSGESDSRY